MGLDADTKLVISHLVGRRTAQSAYYFMRDLKSRITSRIQLTTDGFRPYLTAVEDAFGGNVDYAVGEGLRRSSAGNGWPGMVRSSEVRFGLCFYGLRNAEAVRSIHVSCGAPEPYHPYADAPVYSTNKRFFKKAGQSQSGGSSPLRALQFRPRSSNITRHASNGSWPNEPCLDLRGIAKVSSIRVESRREPPRKGACLLQNTEVTMFHLTGALTLFLIGLKIYKEIQEISANHKQLK